MKFANAMAYLCLSMTPAVSTVYAACATDDPVAVAKSFYAKHPEFASEDPAKIKTIVTPRFFAALDREHKCTQDGICAIEADPWTDAQDGHIAKPVEFETIGNSDVETVVAMSFPFILDKSHHEQMRAKIVLQRKSKTECWLVGDIVGPHGDSLLQMIEAWHKKYGAGEK